MQTDELESVKPYSERVLDCYQNLVISLLKSKGCEIGYLGACWPWEFVQQTKQVNGESYTYLIDVEPVNEIKLKHLYNVKPVTRCEHDIEAALYQIKRLLDQRIAVIVDFDQYYAHYHYSSIYQKKHGEHALMLTRYNDAQKMFSCISAIPLYEGTIAYEEFLQGFQSTYTYLSYETDREVAVTTAVWNSFLAQIKTIEAEYHSPQAPSGHIVHTPSLKKLLSNILEAGEEHLADILEVLCSGTWGWHIDRRCAWTKDFLLAFTADDISGVRSKLLHELEQNNRDWILVYRFLFKVSQTARKEGISKILDKLDVITEREKQIFKMISHLQLAPESEASS